MAPRCSPVSGSPRGSLPVLTLVVAMTAGCRAVLLAATAFWLACRRLLRPASTETACWCSGKKAPVIGRCRCRSPVHGRTDRVSVADRDASCVTGFHPVGSSSQQQIWRVVVQQACSAGCTSRARISCLAMWTCTWRWPCRDLSIGVRDVDAGLVSGASERAAWLWQRCWLGGALSLGERLLRHSSLALELT